jgi:hypothetical protein
MGFVAITVATIGFFAWWNMQTGWHVPDFWFGASFLALGWVICLSELLHINVKLPNFYHRLRPLEADGSLYRSLGVRFFKRFVVDGDYMNRAKRAKRPGYCVIRTRSDALEREQLSRTTETAHLFHLLLLIPAIVLAERAGRLIFAAAMTALLIGFDLYPVLLQRYNRARVRRIVSRTHGRVQSARSV